MNTGPILKQRNLLRRKSKVEKEPNQEQPRKSGRVNGDGRFRVIEHFGSQEDPTVVDDHFYAGRLKLEPVGNS